MVEHANGGINSDADVTVDDVSQEVLDKVQAGLDALTDDPKTKDEKGERAVLNAVSTADSAVSVADSTVSVADSVVSAAVSSADSVVSAVDSTVVAGDKDYSIQDNLYRTALHEGWKPEEIQAFMELDPDRARATFQKLHESSTGLSKVWADAGRAELLKGDTTQQQQQQTDTATEATKKNKVEFQELDIDKLRKEYDNDPVVDLVEQQQKQNKALFDMVNSLNETISTRPPEQQQQVVDPAAAALATQIDSFFKHPDMKMYDTFYGMGDNLTPGDIANRNAMFELADQIRAGRALQGLDTTVDEALAQAHLLVTEPIREKMVRKDIVSKLKKRSNSLSLRPASAGKDVNAVETTKPKDEQGVIDNAAARLAKIFN